MSAALALACASGAQEQNAAVFFPQLGHAFPVTAIAFSPDGKTLASGSADRTIRLWDTASGRELRTLEGHKAAVASLTFSPDGRLIASAGPDRSIRLWFAASGATWHVLGTRDANVYGIVFSPDGRSLLAGLSNGGIEAFDVAGGHDITQVGAVPGQIVSVAYSRDSRWFATGNFDGTISLWDTRNWQLLRTLKGHAGPVRSVSFSPDGNSLASASQDKTIKVWRIPAGEVLKTLEGHTDAVAAVLFSPDGKSLLSCSADKTVRMWTVANGRAQVTPTEENPLAIAFAPDGRSFAWGGWDHVIHIADSATSHEKQILQGRTGAVEAIAVSPDGKMLAAPSWDHSIALWDVASGQLVRRLTGHSAGVGTVAFSPDGKLLASGSADKTVRVWDVASGGELRTLAGHKDNVTSVAFSPDGKLLASGSDDHAIKLWDMGSGQELRTLAGHTDAVEAVAFSPDGKMLASGSDDHAIKLWDPASGSEIRTLSGHTDWVSCLMFSPDGKTLASGGFDDVARLWDVESGHLTRTLDGKSDNVAGLAFSPDGNLLAAANGDHSVTLWDVASGTTVRKLLGHTNVVNGVAFTADAKTLFSASTDGTSRVWDVASGARRAALMAFTDGSSLAVTPAGFFASSSEQAEENLNVRVNSRVFGISSFRETFYRPDLVTKALAGEDISRYGSIDSVKLSPIVELAGVPAATTGANLKMTLRLTNSGGGFGPVRLFWNGTVIIQDSDLPASGDTLVRTYTVPLHGGDNELRATAFNADGTMWSDARASVAANLPRLRKSRSARGTLHAVVIGIQNFPKGPENDLKYAIADATLIAATLKEKAAPLFTRLDVRLLTTTAETDKAHIVNALRAIQAAAKPDDELIFYVASHGIVADNRYYIATSDLDPTTPSDLPAHALSAKELAGLLANVLAARKLVILDTCDAGAAGAALTTNAGPSAKRTATILGRAFGFTVLAAANSDQEALEGYKDHGLFSFVTADGLGGQAADSATGIVDSFVLANYVKGRVPVLAETLSAQQRTQQPTAETSGRSFPVTKVR